MHVIKHYYFFFVSQRNRLERLSIFGNHHSDECEKYPGSSAATTVVRKTTNSKNEHRSSISSTGTITRHSYGYNNQILTNKHAIEPRSSSIINPFNSTNYSGQQLLLTSGDIEAMTMKQFRMGSLGY
jgi:hypothetical protein